MRSTKAIRLCAAAVAATAAVAALLVAPTSGAAAADDQLDEYMHLYTLNRGVLMTPFHNMALMCPASTAADVDRHTEVFGGAVAELSGA